jgi:cytochrome bd-type quinol oxidase subunit 1
LSTTEYIIGVGVLFLLFTWLAVFDVARKDFGTKWKQVMWGFIALIPFIGPVIYFIIGYRVGKKPVKPDAS